MADRFYLNSSLAVGPVTLRGDEAHHLAAVRRLRAGDRVCLFNGDGREYAALVTGSSRRDVELFIEGFEVPNREWSFRLEVAAPLPKGDRAQFLVEKLTELGVSRFVPLQTRRSIVQPREAKMEKLQRYVIEASKQCGRNVLMQIDALTAWEAYCRRDDLPDLRILAHPGEAIEPWPTGQDVAVAVGPEGGFTDAEVAAGRVAGWRLVGLGPRTLRVETAALFLAVRAADTPVG